ncbi:signal peptide peptidase SppA [Pseudomonas sp. 2FE]|uniref:signal peptide peptidase SppA n=1 Tax=Pseudomonas sp. 2FE TaxID=2502190 RepID=UPI0010F47CCD|nr:signal peptide peptidase SppA [Pseudomonas sp. 2FE]
MDKSLEVLERTLQASIIEQRAARRWTNFYRLGMAAIVVTLVFFGGQSEFEGEDTGGSAVTAKIKVKGVIADGEEASADNIKRSLAKAFENEDTKAVILEINSPGGSPVQSGQVYDEIKRQRALYPDKKVYAVISDLGASGGYYIASAADEIFADKSSLVGSIGVTAASFGFVELMNKLGVERRAFTSGEHKAFLDQFQPQNPEETVFWEGVLKTTHKQFIESVEAGRGERLKSKEHPEVYSGLIWTGEQALGLGLVDKLGDADYVAREVVGASKIVDFTRRQNPLDRFANKIGASVAEQLSMRLGFNGPTLR